MILGNYLYLNTATGVDNTHKRIRAPDAPSLVVLDKKTGRLVARDGEHIAPDIFHCTWSSPSLGEAKGRPLIFFAGGNGVVYAFETLAEGRQPVVSGQVTAAAADSPTPPDDQQRTTDTPVRRLKKVWQFDFDPAAPKRDVHSYLSNRREGPSNISGMPARTGEITTTGLIWSYPLQKHVMSTPAILNGLVFIADCGRAFHCLDAETGQPHWTEEIKGEAWASPLVADGKVYLGTRSGSFYVFAASKEKKLLSTVELGDPISATATAANGVLYVATMRRLYAVALPKSPKE